ncbi:uncharacterized protein LOC132284977 isoform X2 [Cornus florida]|uniref:uncharacterized protein LOC132284977 isoform X2 n=1 Tax=Cornus florida TaxID=4283 RepID=UPI00289DC4C4|nr:uncharacterized protein LOC132284977 isoform X2 [Cornus florida]
MFERVIRSKFYTKCKSAIKLTKTRIEMIQRKRNAMQKYLRNDVADLLKTGLDMTAYSRVEGLLLELNMSSCYDFVENFCGCILNHLSLMNKQRECPEECKEAVSSLMFAAARFADLPELRDLRSIFTGRYGSSIDSYVNQEFVEKLKSVPPTKDMKLQLMQNIGLVLGIEWDSKALEQRLYNPPAPKQDWTKNVNDDHYKLHKTGDTPFGKIDNHHAGNKHNNVRDYTDPKRDKDHLLSYGGKQVNNDKYKLHDHRENVSHKEDNPGIQFQETEIAPSKDVRVADAGRNGQRNNFVNSVKSVSQEEVDDKMPFYHRIIPPPYVKPKVSKNETMLQVPPADNDMQGTGAAKLSGHVEGEDNHDQDKLAGEAKPKPRSVRSRRSKLPPAHDNAGIVETDGLGKVKSDKMKQDAKRGLKILTEDGSDKKAEEEGVTDRLLMRYSMKQSCNEQGKLGIALEPPSQHAAAGTSNDTRNCPPARAKSFPQEPVSVTEAPKGHVRASSYQPDMLNPVGHGQSKLLDYDDFVARLAALKGK